MLGAGTQANPYIIQTPQDLSNIRTKAISTLLYYELGNDIDMSSFGNFTPIGVSNNKFRGKFNGKGYKIKNLTINSSVSFTGLFAYIDGTAEIKNIAFENVSINNPLSVASATGTGVVAGMASYTSPNTPIVENISVSGTITGTFRVSSIVGVSQGIIRHCYSSAKLIANHPTYPRVAGITYSDSVTYDTVQNCIFNGTYEIIGTGTQYIHAITNESNSKTLTNIYYNSDNIIPNDNPVNAKGLTTEQFKDSSNFTSLLSNTTFWAMGTDSPYLKTFGIPLPPSQKVTIAIKSTVSKINSNVSKSRVYLQSLQSFVSDIGTHSLRSIKRKFNVSTNINHIEADSLRLVKILRKSLSNIQSIKSNRNITKRKSITSNADIQPITTNVDRFKRRFREVLSYSNAITSSSLSIVIPFVRKTIAVSTSMLPIQSIVERNRKRFKQSQSIINSIEADKTISKKRFVKLNNSFMRPIETNVAYTRIKNALRNINTWSKKVSSSVKSIIDKYIPPKVDEINVEVSYTTNNSLLQVLTNTSKLEPIFHKTQSETINHTTQLETLSHQTILNNNGGD